MMVSFDTNILVYATPEVLLLPSRRPFGSPRKKTEGARSPLTRNADGIARSAAANPCGVQQRGNSLGGNKGRRSPKQRSTSSERCCLSKALRMTIFSAALDAAKKHRLAFWDAMLRGNHCCGGLSQSAFAQALLLV